jgi:hypothetical protein
MCKGNSLASPISTTPGRLPAGNLTLSTEVASEADSLPSLPGLLEFLLVPTEGDPSDDQFPLSL